MRAGTLTRRTAVLVARALRCKAVAVLAALAACAAHTDDTMAAAQSAYVDGRFLEAAGLAEAAGTSTGNAFAAMCVALQGHYLAPDDAKRGLFTRAMALADEAIRLDPENPNAYLQSAHALGRFAQSIGNLRAVREGLAGKTHDRILAALDRDEHEAAIHLSLGSWHADIVAAGFVARAMFRDANKAEAVEHFERALALDPGSKIVRLEYARRLPKLDRRDGRTRARRLLSEAAALPVRDFYDGLVHDNVQQELAGLD